MNRNRILRIAGLLLILLSPLSICILQWYDHTFALPDNIGYTCMVFPLELTGILLYVDGIVKKRFENHEAKKNTNKEEI